MHHVARHAVLAHAVIPPVLINRVGIEQPKFVVGSEQVHQIFKIRVVVRHEVTDGLDQFHVGSARPIAAVQVAPVPSFLHLTHERDWLALDLLTNFSPFHSALARIVDYVECFFALAAFGEPSVYILLVGSRALVKRVSGAPSLKCLPVLLRVASEAADILIICAAILAVLFASRPRINLDRHSHGVTD